MRFGVVAWFLIAAGAVVQTARAEQLWCAVSHDGATDCSLTSLEQCREKVTGVGGFCMPQAPVGHRQPRASDIPADVPKNESDIRLEQQNRKLDRTMKLCRGC